MRTLSIENLRAGYSAVPVLHGVSLEIHQGELVAIIGPNGAGKSTLLRAISGLAAATGVVEFEGRNLLDLKPQEIVRSGVIQCPEGRQLFPDLTVRENLNLGAYLRADHAETRRDLNRVLSLFPVLNERKEQRAGTLSGGEQQMLAIGRALMSKPKILMLDEPSFGIAPIVIDRIYNVIQELNAEGLTALVVEQNVPLALDIASRTYVLQAGRVVMHGSASELKEDPALREAYLGM